MAPRSPGKGMASVLIQMADRMLVQLSHFDTGYADLGAAHKAGVKNIVRQALRFGHPPQIFCEGMASVTGDPKFNENLAGSREESVEQYLYGLLLGRISLEPAQQDAFRTSLADIGQPLDRRQFPLRTLPGGQNARVVISSIPGEPVRPVAIAAGRADGSKRHAAMLLKHPEGDRDRNNAMFRAVMVQVTPVDKPRPPPLPPVDPGAPQIFRFRMRVAPEQPTQPKDINKAISNGLTVLKGVKSAPGLKKALELLSKRVPKLAEAAGRAADIVKYIKYAMGLLGVELIGFDIMDEQRKRGGRYVYFGLAPSTDVIADFVFDQVVDKVLDFIKANNTLPLNDGLEKELFEALAKLGLKDVADKVKKAGQFDLIPPFPFTELTVASLPMAGLFSVDLDSFQGAFSCTREGGTLTVTFDEGISGPVHSNTIPRFITLKTGATASLSLRFGLLGVIFLGAGIPYVEPGRD